MKPITIRNQQYYYKVFWDVSEFGESTWTIIYKKLEPKLVRKYWLFGELISKDKYEEVHKIGFNIESPMYDQKRARQAVEEFLRIYDRKLEIERGEII